MTEGAFGILLGMILVAAIVFGGQRFGASDLQVGATLTFLGGLFLTLSLLF